MRTRKQCETIISDLKAQNRAHVAKLASVKRQISAINVDIDPAPNKLAARSRFSNKDAQASGSKKEVSERHAWISLRDLTLRSMKQAPSSNATNDTTMKESASRSFLKYHISNPKSRRIEAGLQQSVNLKKAEELLYFSTSPFPGNPQATKYS